MNSHGGVAGGQSSDFRDRRGVQFFEIADDDLAVDRFELLNQRRQPFQIDALVRGGFALLFVGKGFELFKAHQSRESPALAKNMRGRDVVSHAIDPGAQGTASVETLEAPPQLKVNLLEQVATFFRVSFVGARETIERTRELFRSVAVHIVLARVSGGDGFSPFHI